MIIDVDFAKATEVWSSYAKISPEVIKSRFAFDVAYEQHERGEMTGEAYFASLQKQLGIHLKEAEIQEGWNAIYKGEVLGIKYILNQAKQYFSLYGFSNTNPTHWTYACHHYAEVLGLSEKLFTSFELKKRKPDREAFESVAKNMGVDLSQILFFDDLLENVDGAKAAGLQAVYVKTA